MERTKEYPRVEFSTTALQKIVTEFKNIVKDPAKLSFSTLMIKKMKERWRYDTFEEFLAELDNDASYASLSVSHPELSIEFSIWPAGGYNATEVSISSATGNQSFVSATLWMLVLRTVLSRHPQNPRRKYPNPRYSLVMVDHLNGGISKITSTSSTGMKS